MPSKRVFDLELALLVITRAVCLVYDLDKEKEQAKQELFELKPKEKSKVTKEESAMNDAILEELKSLRSDLTKQMQ